MRIAGSVGAVGPSRSRQRGSGLQSRSVADRREAPGWRRPPRAPTVCEGPTLLQYAVMDRPNELSQPQHTGGDLSGWHHPTNPGMGLDDTNVNWQTAARHEHTDSHACNCHAIFCHPHGILSTPILPERSKDQLTRSIMCGGSTWPPGPLRTSRGDFPDRSNAIGAKPDTPTRVLAKIA